jgi:hypothetical protein
VQVEIHPTREKDFVQQQSCKGVSGPLKSNHPKSAIGSKLIATAMPHLKNAAIERGPSPDAIPNPTFRRPYTRIEMLIYRQAA